MSSDLDDPRHSALDSTHALVIAVHDATRFHGGGDGGGLVARLRGLAAAAAQAAFVAGREEAALHAAGWRAPLDLLCQLGEGVSQARAAGLLDQGGAAEIADLESRARGALGTLLAGTRV